MQKLVNVEHAFDWKISLINELIKRNSSMNPINSLQTSIFCFFLFRFLFKKIEKEECAYNDGAHCIFLLTVRRISSIQIEKSLRIHLD